MNLIHQGRLLIAVVIIQLATFSCRQDSHFQDSGGQAPLTTPSPIDICSSTADFANSDGKFVKIHGSITGYHELMLFGPSCFSKENFYELRMEKELFDELLSQNRRLNPHTTDVKGTITVSGRLIKGGGRLIGYPGRVINAAGPFETIPPLIVDRIEVTAIDGYKVD